jgi:hypothetical protein
LAESDEVGTKFSMPVLYSNLSAVPRYFFIYFSLTGLNEYLPLFLLIFSNSLRNLQSTGAENLFQQGGGLFERVFANGGLLLCDVMKCF